MARSRRQYVNLLSGQNDTRIEEATELPRLTVVENMRLRRGIPEIRNGMRRIAVAGTDATALDGTAASSMYASFPAASQHALPVTFTIEMLFQPDAVSGTQVLAGFGHATNYPFRIYLTDADVKCDVILSDGTSYTLSAPSAAAQDTTAHVMLRRYADTTASGGSFIFEWLVNGVQKATQLTTLTTLSLKAAGGALYLFRDNTGNYFDGSIDYFRAYSFPAADCNLAHTRWPTPKQKYMLWDYTGEIDSNNWVLDRSPYGNHGAIQNALTTSAALAINPAPVQMIHPYRDKDNKSRVLLGAGGRVYSVGV